MSANLRRRSIAVRFRFAILLLAAAACTPREVVPPVSAPPPAEQAPAGIVRVLELAGEAQGAGNDSAFVRYVEIADSLVPHHPALLAALARGYARMGDTAGALGALARLAPFGLARDVAQDSTFTALWGTPRFASLAQQLAANAAPIARSDTALIVPGPDLLPESIAHDSADGSFYLGSLSANQVIRVTPAGDTSTFASVGEPGRVVGIKIGAPRRTLWVTSTARDTAAPAEDSGRSGSTALYAYDLQSGNLVRRYAPSDFAGARLFNDVAVSTAGDVFVTDTDAAAVYRLPSGADTLELFHRGGPGFHWPNGIALSPDDSRLYVAHLEGITTWDLRTGEMRRLTHPDTVATIGIDGLYACRDALIAVQRTSDFKQVARLHLSPAGDRITGGNVLERRHPAYQQPTTGVIVGDALYYIANSQVARLRPDGTLAPAAEPQATVILRLPLGASCR